MKAPGDPGDEGTFEPPAEQIRLLEESFARKQSALEEQIRGLRQSLVEGQANTEKQIRLLGKQQSAVIAGLRSRNAQLLAALTSVEEWQRSWFRRAFRRWHMVQNGRSLGFFRRLERSVGRSGRKVLFALHLNGGGAPADARESDPGILRVAEDPQIPGNEESFKMAFRAGKEEELEIFLQSGDQIDLPQAPNPKVSILLVLFNQAALTLSCLRSLEMELHVPFEVVIVDNCSTDQTGALLERVPGARVIRNSGNLGFVRAVNQAAAASSGEHLLLLNNDATLRFGCLASALKTLESSPDIGAVGGRLVLPDGSLQEAGSLVWSDGSCLGYGRGLDQNAGEGMFRRDVDYCSGAFLLIPRTVFDALGGLDEEFSPAYFEEVDLCLKMQEKGLRVVYEPQAVVDHYEFASSGSQEAACALQLRNAGLFRAKHEQRLSRQWMPAPGNVIKARARNSERGNILFLDDQVPIPSRGSGCPRALEMLRVLHRAGFFVTLWPVREMHAEWEGTYRALPREIEVVSGRGTSDILDFLLERPGFYRAIIVSRPHNMRALLQAKKQAPHVLAGVKIIYDAEAVFAIREVRRAEVLGKPMSKCAADALVQEELDLTEGADVISITSAVEAGHFRAVGRTNLHVVTHSLRPVAASPAFDRRSGFLFVGRMVENDSPNTDSIVWFVEKILPRIRRELGQAIAVHLVGKNGASRLRNLGNGSIRFLGSMEDLAGLYGSARVFIAPTRFAAGIPHKVHEASAHGLPVAATALLAEQLQWVSGEDLLASDCPEEFAQNCIRLHTQPELWGKLRGNALSRVANECSSEAFARSVVSLVQ